MTGAQANLTAIGMIMPVGCKYGQDLADLRGGASRGFALGANGCNLEDVVAAIPQMVRTHCLYRYPSPDRRLCAPLRRPPLFLFTSAHCADRRCAARRGGYRAFGFDVAAVLFLTGLLNKSTKEGVFPCRSNSVFPYSRLSRPHSQVVATHCRNRRLSARVPGSARRPSSMDRLAPARLSARRATWPIVRPIRANADPLRHIGEADCGPASTSLQAIGGPRGASVAFFVTQRPGKTAQGGQDKGDERCSRRS